MGNCKQCGKEGTIEFDGFYFCCKTCKKLYCRDKLESGTIEERYVVELYNGKFLNSNFKLSTKIRSTIMNFIWLKENKPKLCVNCSKDLFEAHLEKDTFYNPFKEERFCSYKCHGEFEKQKLSERVKENFPEYHQKSKMTKFEKYGDENYTNRNKARDTYIRQYGVEHHLQKNFKNYQDLNKEFWEENFIEDGYFNFQACSEYHNINIDSLYSKLKEFKIEYKRKSKTQYEIYQFIKEKYDGEVILDDRTQIAPLELDIYVPELSFAIEYDGLFFHSEGYSDYFPNIDKKYHLTKTELCEERDIHLFHIFSNEWLDDKKRDIWKSKILYKLKKIEAKLNARDGEIRYIPTSEAQRFLEENHLQGYAQCSDKLGLYIKGELVSVMTFGKSRFKKGEIELIRFASKKYTIVRGAFNKMLSFFKNTEEKIISYGNRRWTYKENVYKGYQKTYKYSNINNIETTTINYFYFKDERELFSRVKFQKHKLSSLLNNFNKDLSESENMFLNGYRKIYDCGNYKFFL